MQDELLTIGRFARMCRLSIKQLRHYDETGLLAPTLSPKHNPRLPPTYRCITRVSPG
ncbi:MerR family DNA-binding transcriptional regulator, partial [Streptomyces alfalfae]